MKAKISRGVALAVVFGMVAVALAFAPPPPIPKTPAAVRDVISAQPFSLERGYEHEWRKEQPTVTHGWIVVLDVDKDLVFPRQVAEPVLYVGRQTAQRVNVGQDSGKVIAIVPGDVDLKKDLFWFGAPTLPESVDAAMIAAELRKAEQAGIKPMSAEKIKALEKDAKPQRFADREALLRHAADLIERHSPTEISVIAGLRMN